MFNFCFGYKFDYGYVGGGLKRRFDSKEYMLALAEKARLLTAKMQQ